jgi:hypothetical protein
MGDGRTGQHWMDFKRAGACSAISNSVMAVTATSQGAAYGYRILTEWERVMTTNSAELELTINELRDEELVCVVGGSGAHIPNIIIEDVGGGGSGVGGNTPAGAWNACLGVFGYPPMA